jgi:3-oxoadipate enol-lactonase
MLLHALRERASTWTPVMARFAGRYGAFAVDLRGHGRSDWPGTYSFHLMRDDVVALIECLGLRKVTLVGHSMGGTVAYLVAMTRPGQVGGPIIDDVPCPIPETGLSPNARPGHWTSTGPWYRPSSARSTSTTPQRGIIPARSPRLHC